MMGFSDYLWALLPKSFKGKQDNDASKWVGVLGDSLDTAKAAIFLSRRAWLIATASGNALDNHGRTRGLPRYPGESDDLYRRRLLAAYEIYALGGTSRGIIRALELMGYPHAQVHELYRDGVVTPLHGGTYVYDGQARHRGGVRWAEFRVIMGIEDDRPFTRDDLAVIQAEIYRMKPAHTMPTGLALELDFDEYVPTNDDAEYQVVFVVHALNETFPWPGATHAGLLIHDGVARHDTHYDDSAARAELKLLDRQAATDVRHNRWFRHDQAVNHGAQPAILQVGEVSAAVFFTEPGPAAAENIDIMLSLRGQDQFPDEPSAHDGSLAHAATSRYGRDRIIDSGGTALRLSWEDILPGTGSYGSAFLRHDGSGARWIHNGAIRRTPFARHNGKRSYSDQVDRRRTTPHWGERAYRHNGMEPYGRLSAHDSSMTHGANGPVDGFGVVVTRNGRRVAA